MTKKIVFSLVVCFICFQHFAFAEEKIDINQALNEAQEKFAFDGKPIHPGLVQEFESWMSDPGIPTIVTVDVAAEHGNEYFEYDVQVKDNNNVCLVKEGERGYFCYKWLGRLNNGLHVLDVRDSGGGSGIFESLLFVKFDKGEGYTVEGQKYSRLLMTIVRDYSLGDRETHDIKLMSDKVIIDASKFVEF